MIETALFTLMEKKSFAQITISELVKQADVARRTFYRSYESKEEVLHGYFEKLCRMYQNEAKPLEGYAIEQVARDYFSFWYQYREFLLLLHRSGLDELLYYEISQASLEVVKSRISSEKVKQLPGMEYFAAYSVGGFINLLQHWIITGMEEMPEVYADKVSTAILRVMGTADKRS